MAAPSGTVWGGIVKGSTNGRQGRIGIYTKASSTDTKTTVNVQVWFWTIYSCSDGWNVFYFDVGENITSATTLYDPINIEHTVASGEEWNTANQTKLIDKTYTYTRTKSKKTYKAYAEFYSIDMLGDKVMYANTSYTVPALASYTISYNANGGSSAPSSQTKWYGEELTLSSTKPTRTGYSFQGWSTSTDSTVEYDAGDSYTANSGAILYAVWKANTYDVLYNANGGTGAPGKQTKTYGTTLKLSSIVPTRQNYNFLGWGTSASSTTVAYAAGANYTKNAGITLYAIWELAYVKPRITNLSVTRCNTDGSASDDGACASIEFHWESDQAVSSITVAWESAGHGSGSENITGQTGTVGDVSYIFGNGTLSTEATYTITLTVTDTNGYSVAFGTLNGSKFAIDFLAGGNGAAFGKPAELDGVLDIAFQTRFLGGILHPVLEPETDLNTVLIPNTYIGANITTYKYYNCPLTSGTFALEVIGMGEEGQVKQRLTYCHKTLSKAWERIYYASSWGEWVCVSDFDGQLLWEGVYYMSASQTVPLAEPISEQRSGIVLIFSRYSGGEAHNYHFNTFFIPKYQITKHTGCGHTFMMTTDGTFSVFASKYLYINDTTIVGNDNNEASGTGSCGITYANNGFVLRYVIGV